MVRAEIENAGAAEVKARSVIIGMGIRRGLTQFIAWYMAPVSLGKESGNRTLTQLRYLGRRLASTTVRPEYPRSLTIGRDIAMARSFVSPT